MPEEITSQDSSSQDNVQHDNTQNNLDNKFIIIPFDISIEKLQTFIAPNKEGEDGENKEINNIT
jgi:hypothetical protein